MKIKVFNNMFFDASYSFSMLRFYYRDLMGYLRKSNDDFHKHANEVETEYKTKQKEFNKEWYLKHLNMYEEFYPTIFNNSFLISACAIFESQINNLCNLIKEEHQLPVEWEDMEGSVPTKTKRFLGFAGIVIKDDPPKIVLAPPNFVPSEVPDENRIIMKDLWQEIENIFRVRNCLTHHNGLILKLRYPDKLKKYSTEKGIIVNKAGQLEILLTDSFNINVCTTMETFFDKLLSAYYSTKLPE